jgi:hypothetical protein
MKPVCPANYSCTFSPDRPPRYDVWWEGPWGIVVACLIVIVVASVLAYVASLAHERWEVRNAERRRDADHQRKLAIEEQRTLQLDTAKGNPEVLKMINDDWRRRS